jgi:hypothetical protein
MTADPPISGNRRCAGEECGGRRAHASSSCAEGDYVILGPDVVHFWEAIGDTLVATVRFPSIEVKGSGDERRPIHAR